MGIRKSPVATLTAIALLATQGLVECSDRSNEVSAQGPQPLYPVHSGTTPYCTWWWDNNGSIPCEDMPDAWLITREDFLRWNPGIGPNCEGFPSQWSYCVEAFGEPPPTTTTRTTTSPTTSSSGAPTNGVVTPSPTQPDIVDNCDRFVFVEPETSCASILSSNGITLAQFREWNPSVGSNCQSLWANVYVCVSIIGHEPGLPTSTTHTSTSTRPTSTNGIETPVPIQSGMVNNCDVFAFVETDQTCDDIARIHGITFTLLLRWNPSVGSTCGGLWANVWVCVSVIGHTPPPSTTVAPPPTTTSGNGIQTPTPTQSGMIRNCRRFHFVQVDQSCQTLMSLYRVTLQNLVTWNPAVGSDCRGLWANTYACVGV
ncbi:hypothetical protein S7711_04139 [Stachybotrys chartarum IBT 7711]|uniref:LysM domain-containing protein n=1 Tax=Stachybotrys chartarum (strain CBS 109288 / IBT 7711) TaxID=1280523 RepID=A0A084B6J4_STACB|nr:hypothetical protein S7711_04139 [Stachybotrys chartarum IBT 7711]